MKHWRFTFLMKRPRAGGQPINTPFKGRRWTLFRSDLRDHGVCPVKDGSRYTLSVGLRYGKGSH